MGSNTEKRGGYEDDVYAIADKDGHVRRKASQFRNWVTADPSSTFPAEKGRYVLYINLGCPWYDPFCV